MFRSRAEVMDVLENPESGYSLPQPVDRETTIDPQENGGLLFSDENQITHISGSVSVPGAEKPVEYSGSMPDQLHSRLTNIVVPGFGGVGGSYVRFADAMAAQEGVFTISFTPARSSQKLSDPQRVHSDTIAAITQNLPNNNELDNTQNGTDIDFSQVTTVLHSMGGIPGTRYALKNPGEVANAVYMNSVGLERSRLPGRYLMRIGPCAATEMLPAFINGDFKDFRNITTAWRMGKHLLGNMGQTGGEIITCHTSNLLENIVELGKLGVKRAMFYGGKDHLVPAEPSVKLAGHLVDYCLVAPELDHFGPQKKPEITAGYIGNILRELSPAPTS